MKIISRKEAKALGLKRYFTGESCRNGHITARWVAGNHCIECHYQKPSYRKHIKGVRKATKIAIETAIALGLKRYFTGRPCKRGHVAERFLGSKQCVKCAHDNYTIWRKTYPERSRKATRAWQKRNPERYRSGVNKRGSASYHNRKALKNGNGGSHTEADIADLYRLQGGRCACGCNEPLKKKYHRDHIVPLSLGGSNDKRNLQLLRPVCNLRKWAKDPIAWAQENGRLL